MTNKIRDDDINLLNDMAWENIDEMKAGSIHNPIRFSNEMKRLGVLEAIGNLFDKDVKNGTVQVNECLKDLILAERLDLSMECLVINNKKFHYLFNKQQRDNARLLLEACRKKS